MPTDISPTLGMSISNVICTIIMGMRFHHGDLQFKRFMDLIEEGFRLFGKMAIVNYIPITRFIFGMSTIPKKIAKNRTEMANFFQQNIEEHRATFNKEKIRDLVDSYLLEIERAKEESRETRLYEGKDAGE